MKIKKQPLKPNKQQKEQAMKTNIKLNQDYWDCECETNYIHKKTELDHCVKCDTYEEDQPDSRQEEIDNMKTPTQKFINGIETILFPNTNGDFKKARAANYKEECDIIKSIDKGHHKNNIDALTYLDDHRLVLCSDILSMPYKEWTSDMRFSRACLFDAVDSFTNKLSKISRPSINDPREIRPEFEFINLDLEKVLPLTEFDLYFEATAHASYFDDELGDYDDENAERLSDDVSSLIATFRIS